jgi:hypothetical protein
VCGCVGVGVGGCVYKIKKFRTLSAPSEIALLREAISSSAAFELFIYYITYIPIVHTLSPQFTAAARSPPPLPLP